MTSSDLSVLPEIGDRIVYLFSDLRLTYHFEKVAVIIGNSVNVKKKKCCYVLLELSKYYNLDMPRALLFFLAYI